MSIEQENEVQSQAVDERIELEVESGEISEEEKAFNDFANDVPAITAETEVEQTQAEPEADESENEEIKAVEQAKDELKEAVEAGGLSKDEARKIYGKIGELNAKLAEIKAAASAPVKLKFDAASFKKITENFDSDFAQNLADDLNSAFGIADEPNMRGQAELLDANLISQLEDKFEKKMQTNLLKMAHKDYQQVYQSEDFAIWKQTLPEVDQDEIESSWNAEYLSEKLTEFKTWRDVKTSKQASGSQRLKNAVQPQGGKVVQKAAMTEEDGFNSVAM